MPPTIYDYVASLVRFYGCCEEEDPITPDQTLVYHFGLDSLDMLSVAIDLENYYDIDMDVSDWDAYTTVADDVEQVKERV